MRAALTRRAITAAEAAVVVAEWAAVVVEASLHMEVVAVVQALAVVHALAVAAERARALVPNVARADRGWEIAVRPQAFTTARVEHGIRVGKGDLGNFRHGIVTGNFFEHGRHFGFRRFWNDQWVFLTAWDSCTAWAWVNVAPGAWAWTPIDICIG